MATSEIFLKSDRFFEFYTNQTVQKAKKIVTRLYIPMCKKKT